MACRNTAPPTVAAVTEFLDSAKRGSARETALSDKTRSKHALPRTRSTQRQPLQWRPHSRELPGAVMHAGWRSLRGGTTPSARRIAKGC